MRRSRAASTLAAAAERRDVPIEGSGADARRRRWYVVAAALATTPYQRRRGGPAYRHVDIETGSHEFLLGQSNEWREPLEAASDARARSLSGERPARVRAPWVERVAPPPGFVVHRTEVDALSAQISADARHATAPRALLEVLVGGAPLREKGGAVRFYVVTPVVIVAEGAEYSELHRQFFGDPWMYPAAGVEADAVNAARRMGALLPPFNPVVADLVGEEVADWSRF